MNTYKYIFTGALLFIFLFGFSQKGKIRQAKSSYDKFAYIKTSEILLEVANGGYKSAELFEKLGDSYYFNNNMEDASNWYGELMALEEIIDPEYYFRYSLALKSIAKYKESDKWMKKFNDERSDDLRGKAFLSNVDYLTKIDALSRDDIEVVNLELNSTVSDFGAMLFDDQLIFASTRGNGKVYKWNEQPFLDLYSAQKNDRGGFDVPVALPNTINTKFHESSAAFTPNQKFLFFTRNNYYKRKLKKDSVGVNRLQLFRATRQENGDWADIVPVHFNADAYSVAHPSISADGTKLFFASDMTGSVGQSDLFVVGINEDGTLGTPENLGQYINTEGQESFPFINEKGDLYFSSNGYPGLGGLDIFVIRNFGSIAKIPTTKYEIENVGRPINSPNDDFGYYENLNTKEGFFTSNRSGGKGDDDVYAFNVIEPCKQIIEGKVKDIGSNAYIEGALVSLFDENGTELEKIIVGINGTFSFEVDCDKEYLVRGAKDAYIANEQRFTTPSARQELAIALLLKKDEQEVTLGDDLAKTLDIPIIYFDFDKSIIRYDAEVELQKVLAVLNKYPNMVIDIRSHTDSRGPAKYNQTLSGKRAQSTRLYLIEKGIAKERIAAKGYGESNLKNKCADGVPCAQEEHQLNRRSEFIITEM